MSPRGGPPLFDLISRREASSGPPPDPRPRRREAGERCDRPTATTGRLEVPVPWIYGAAGGLLVLLLVAYGVGYSVGAASRDDEIRRMAQQDAEQIFIEDPLQEPEPGTAGPDRASATREPAGAGEARILTAQGPVAADPREEGVNYLELATLPRDKADEAVRFLASQRVEAIAVPAGLDRGRRAPNTSDRYRVIALGLAVPSGRFSASAGERRRFEERMAQLGKRWTEMGGASDFSSPLWRRFGG